MFARVITAQIRHDRLAEMRQLFQHGVADAFGDAQGFKGALWLMDTQTGKSLSILLWESEDELRKGERDAAHQNHLTQMAVHCIGTPTRELYCDAQDVLISAQNLNVDSIYHQ